MAMFTKNKVMRVPDYHDLVVRTYINKTPLLALLKRGPKPKDWEQEVELEGKTPSYDMAAPEGGVFDTSKLGKRVNMTMKHELQKFRTIKGWSVTDEAENMPSHTELKGEKTKAREQRKDAQELILSEEHAFSSDQEAVLRGDADDGVAKSRGLMCWLKALKLTGEETPEQVKQAIEALHPVHTIKAELCPRNGFEGDVLSALTEEVFWDMVTDMADEQGDDHLSLTMLAGSKLKKHMSSWLYRVKAQTGVENAYRLNQMAGSKKKSLICDVFEYDSVTVRVIRDNHLMCKLGNPENGIRYYDHDENAKLAGALIRPEYWSLDVFEELKNVDLPKQGDVTCGYHKLISRLACRNALAQGRIINKVSSTDGTGA